MALNAPGGLQMTLERVDSILLRPTDPPMRSTQQFSITLPNDMADALSAKVATGECATESEVIRDGLRMLLARDHPNIGVCRE